MTERTHYKYPSINQYRHFVKDVTHLTRYQGDDENGKAIYNMLTPLPTIHLTRSVKTHGTCASITLDIESKTMWAGSPKRILEEDMPDHKVYEEGEPRPKKKDNAGFTKFVNHNCADVLRMFNRIKEAHPEETKEGRITIFCEWAGGSIQKGVGISGTEKFMNVFEYHINDDTFLPDIGLTEGLDGIYNIHDFGTALFSIDLNEPQDYVNSMVDACLAVEDLCPIGVFFGKEGIGEGHVYSTVYKGVRLRFKVKGEKHSNSKTKNLAPVDPEKLASIKEFVDYCYTENRFEQGLEKVFQGDDIEVRRVGEFLGWVTRDILKEESDTLEASGLTKKEVTKPGTNKAKAWFGQKVIEQDGF